ncbi:MAG: hypothetical protein HYZ37_10455 [Candidatus Solibacter usitatus]|nr:hypothetical protein [Candidatus Solibacter usitatus]
MNPVLSDLAAPIQATVSSFATSTSWQEATEELLRDSRNADSLLAVMLGSATGDATVDQLPAKVSRGLAVLKARISAYRDRYHVQ